MFAAVPRCYPFTGYLFPSRPPRSHARRAQGKKERGSFLPFTMETALYPKNCKCSAAGSLPLPPQLQRPHQPPTAHVSSHLPFLPSTGHIQLIQHRPQERSRTAEDLLLPEQPSEPHPAHKSPPSLPFCYWFSPFTSSWGFVSRCNPAGAGSSARCHIPTNTLKSPKKKKGKVKEISPTLHPQR